MKAFGKKNITLKEKQLFIFKLTVLDKKNVLAVLPIGFGKSLVNLYAHREALVESRQVLKLLKKEEFQNRIQEILVDEAHDHDMVMIKVLSVLLEYKFYIACPEIWQNLVHF